MAGSQVYSCDGEDCGRQKGVTNHWYIVLIDNYSIHIAPWTNESAEGTKDVPKEAVKHICGMECLIKLISKKAPEL